METLATFETGIAAARGIDDVKAVLRAEATRLGFERFSYVQLARPPGLKEAMYVGTFDESWAKEYRDQDLHLHDGVWSQPLRTRDTFLWSDVQDQQDSAARKLVHGPAAEVGLRFGIGIPTHDVLRAPAALHLATSNDAGALRDILDTSSPHLLGMAAIAHKRILALARATNPSEEVSLSPSERRVLLWAARGKPITKLQLSSVAPPRRSGSRSSAL